MASAFEALNNIAEQTKRLIVVLNDNEWSIDRNVGAIARYFHKIVTNEHYMHLHDSAGATVERFGGKTAVEVARRAEEAAKGMLWPSMHVRGVRTEILWADRRAQPAAADRDLQIPQDREAPGAAACANAERARLSAGSGEAEEISRAGPYDPETGET